MFGYVRPPQLPPAETARFQQMYCGLCHTLGVRYGTAARFILNYDFTYLAILLSPPETAAQGEGRCMASPVRKRPYQLPNSALEVAADESVILAYWQARDGVADHDWIHGLKYRGVSGILEPAYRRAAAARPDFDAACRRQLDALAALERENCPSIDRAADAFALLLEHAADELDDPVRRRVLGQLLYHLGRWVYLIDAADDLRRDAADGSYNPVALRYHLKNGMWTADSRRAFVQTLDHSVHMMSTALELWDFGCWKPILEATIYGGLFQVGRAVLDGTFRAQTRGIHGIHKRDEEPI